VINRFVVTTTALIVSLVSSAHALDLYNGALGTTPDAQGWLKFNTDGSSAPVTAGGTTSFSTSANQSERGGFSNYNLIFPVNPTFPPLNNLATYAVSLDMRVLSESHASNDRSGVDLIVLSSDLFGLEISFWQNEVWVQSGPDFQHAEGAAFDTTAAMTTYELHVAAHTYLLTTNGNQLLAGNLRNYSAFGLPYTLPNFVFLGDDTTSAAGSFEFSRLSVLVPEPASVTILFGVSVMYAIGRRR
jgi:hypothetical protein